MRFRLLETGAHDAAFNMALDEAVLEAVAAGASPPTLRFYSWTPPAISIGYFQGMREEIDLAACERLGVEAVRRVTGGGAVFHNAEVTYSVVMREGHELAPVDILESYRLICAGLIAGIGRLGVNASFAPINDIVAFAPGTTPGAAHNPTPGAPPPGEPKKISGNAQTRRKGCLLQHGTLLLDVDVETMFELLLVPQEKLKGKLIADVKQRVVGLRSLLSREVGYREAVDALIQGFGSAWGAELERGEPRADELERASVLAKERYRTEAWKFRR